MRWAWERVGRGKLLLRFRLLGGARRFSADGEERGGGIPWRPPAYSLLVRIRCRVSTYNCLGRSSPIRLDCSSTAFYDHWTTYVTTVGLSVCGLLH